MKIVGIDTYGKPLKLNDRVKVMQGVALGSEGKILSETAGYIFIDIGERIIQTRGPCVILTESAPEVLTQ
jgi:hypothetical protein